MHEPLQRSPPALDQRKIHGFIAFTLFTFANLFLIVGMKITPSNSLFVSRNYFTSLYLERITSVLHSYLVFIIRVHFTCFKRLLCRLFEYRIHFLSFVGIHKSPICTLFALSTVYSVRSFTIALLCGCIYIDYRQYFFVQTHCLSNTFRIAYAYFSYQRVI